jgi:ABC-2 type transport system ATP-binding protein
VVKERFREQAEIGYTSKNESIYLKTNKTILFSSHLLSEVESICDRILLINKGELRADCPMEEAKSYPGGLTAFFQDKTK